MTTTKTSAGELAEALERSDWSNMSIGNKILIKAAIAALRSPALIADGGVREAERLQNAVREQLLILDHWGSGPNPMKCHPAVFQNAAFVMRKLASALRSPALIAAGTDLDLI